MAIIKWDVIEILHPIFSTVKNAQLVVTNNKGKRLNGMKHPHSWSIMDSQQCLDWIVKQLNGKG